MRGGGGETVKSDPASGEQSRTDNLLLAAAIHDQQFGENLIEDGARPVTKLVNPWKADPELDSEPVRRPRYQSRRGSLERWYEGIVTDLAEQSKYGRTAEDIRKYQGSGVTNFFSGDGDGVTIPWFVREQDLPAILDALLDDPRFCNIPENYEGSKLPKGGVDGYTAKELILHPLVAAVAKLDGALDDPLPIDALLVGGALREAGLQPVPDSADAESSKIAWDGKACERVRAGLKAVVDASSGVFLELISQRKRGTTLPDDIGELYDFAMEVCDLAERWGLFLRALMGSMRRKPPISFERAVHALVSMGDPGTYPDGKPQLSWVPRAVLDNELGQLEEMSKFAHQWYSKVEWAFDRWEEPNTEADDLRPAAWFSKITKNGLYSDHLLKACGDGRLKLSKKPGKRWRHNVSEVCRVWPQYAPKLRQALDAETGNNPVQAGRAR